MVNGESCDIGFAVAGLSQSEISEPLKLVITGQCPDNGTIHPSLHHSSPSSCSMNHPRFTINHQSFTHHHQPFPFTIHDSPFTIHHSSF